MSYDTLAANLLTDYSIDASAGGVYTIQYSTDGSAITCTGDLTLASSKGGGGGGGGGGGEDDDDHHKKPMTTTTTIAAVAEVSEAVPATPQVTG